MINKMIIFVLLALVQKSYAQALVHSLPTDKRAKAVMYRPNDIYLVNTNYLVSTDIVFSKNETVKNYHLGDAYSWDVETSDNHLYLKAKKIDASGNLNVTTNKFDYHFLLSVRHARKDDPHQALLIQFVYPKNLLADGKLSLSPIHVPHDICQNKRKYNLCYSYTGNTEQAPFQVFDDGQFTYFKFKKHIELPAIFVVQSDRTEQVVNYRMEDGFVVVERVGKAFTLRNGSTVTSVYNDLYIGNPNRIR